MKVMVVADGTLKGIRKVNNDCHLIAMIKRLKNDANVSKVLIDYDPVVKGDKDYDIEVELITVTIIQIGSRGLNWKIG